MRTFAAERAPTPKAKTLGLPDVHAALRSPGQPLDRVTREFMESRFGHDFGRVRVHAEPCAGDVAAGIGARAFTVRDDIVFGAGEYVPNGESGRRLLAHELTHVVQQRAGVHLRGGAGHAGDAYEQNADAVSTLVAQNKSAASLLRSGGGRQEVRGSAAALQKQEDQGKRKPPGTSSGPSLLPVAFAELDVNPARGAMQRAQMRALKPRVGRKPYSVAEGLPTLFAALLDALKRADTSLTGDAQQSLGLHEWGENTSSEGSTAARPTNDVVYLSGTGIDLSEVFEVMEVLVLSVTTRRELFTTPKDFAKNPLEKIFELNQRVDEIKKIQEEEKKNEASEQSAARSSRGAELLLKVRDLERLVKVDLGALKVNDKGKPAAAEAQTSAGGQSASQAQKEVSASSPKAARPAWYDRDPLGYWNSYPLVTLFESVSGDPYAAGGAVAVVTDKRGTKRTFHYWFDKAGNQRSELLRSAADR